MSYNAILHVELHCSTILNFFTIVAVYNPRCWVLWGLKCQIFLTFGICNLQCECSNMHPYLYMTHSLIPNMHSSKRHTTLELPICEFMLRWRKWVIMLSLWVPNTPMKIETKNYKILYDILCRYGKWSCQIRSTVLQVKMSHFKGWIS